MASSSTQIDNETALDLVKNWATLLLLDVPQFTLFGIDTQIFSVGPNFKGMKMIPPGPHFVYYSSSSKEGNEFSPVIGFFLTTHTAEVVVLKWNQQEERLMKVLEDEEVRYCEAVKHLEFDGNLGPYALEHYGEWRLLSSYISVDVIDRIAPIGGEISIVYESRLIEKTPRTSMEKRLMEQLKINKYSISSEEEYDSHQCYYTAIPSSFKLKGVSGEELTKINIDKTKLLETILMKDYGGNEDFLLGELQFAFVTFMMGQSLEGFLQWKALVSLLLSCKEAPIRTRTQLFSKFIKAVYYQLKHGLNGNLNYGKNAGKGISMFLDEAWFTKDNFLYRLCKDFFPLVLESPVVDGDLLSWTRKLRNLLETHFGWDFDEHVLDSFYEDDEFSPVIVPLEEAS